MRRSMGFPAVLGMSDHQFLRKLRAREIPADFLIEDRVESRSRP